ncbi:unnamed protein product [Ectocarpus fasciculatus]
MPLTRIRRRAVGVLTLLSAEVAHQRAFGADAAWGTEPCRCAILYSGHVRSFVQPRVHLSHKKNLIEQLDIDCHVDVFMHISVEDEVPRRYRKGDFEDALAFTPHTPQETEVEHAVGLLNPISIEYHQEQAGYIPNGCETRCEINAYWQLYKMKAVYRMMEEHEATTGLSYTWVIRSRLDIAWMLPLPPLSRFPPTRVYAGHNFFPLADQFLLAPRRFAQSLFGAVSLCYDCQALKAHRESKVPAQVEGLLRAALRRGHGHGAVPFGYYEFPVVIVRSNEGGVCEVLHPHKLACEMMRASGLMGPLTAAAAGGGQPTSCLDMMNRWHRQACVEMFPSRDYRAEEGGSEATAEGEEGKNAKLVNGEPGGGRELRDGGRGGGEDEQRQPVPVAHRSKAGGEAAWAGAAVGAAAKPLSFEEATRRVEGVNGNLSDLLGAMKIHVSPTQERLEYYVAHHYPFHHVNPLRRPDRGPLDNIAVIEGYRLSQADFNRLALSFSCFLSDAAATADGKGDGWPRGPGERRGRVFDNLVDKEGEREAASLSSQVYDDDGTGGSGGGGDGDDDVEDIEEHVLVLKTTAAEEEGLQAAVNCSLTEPLHDVWVSLLDNKFEPSEEICRGPAGPCLDTATPKEEAI